MDSVMTPEPDPASIRERPAPRSRPHRRRTPLSARSGSRREAARRGSMRQALAGKSIALLFEKPSLRTRLTFELAIKQLGGDSVFSEGPIGVREPLKDVARNLDRWVNGIVARVFAQSDRGGSGAVVGGAGDQRAERPVSSLPGAGRCADLRSASASCDGLKLAFVGDGNNVAHSLMLTGAAAGHGFRARHARRATSRIRRSSAQAEGLAAVSGASLAHHARSGGSRRRRARGLHRCVGQHGPGAGSRQAHARPSAHYQVNDELFALARPGCRLHALPARQARRRSDRCDHGAPALGGVRSGRKPAARAKGAAADACSPSRDRENAVLP